MSAPSGKASTRKDLFLLLAQHSLFDATRAPAGKHTAWTYCHVPSGSTVDMTERIVAQIERFFGRVFLFFRLQRPPYSGWSAIVRQVALTYTDTIVVTLTAWHAHRPDLIRSPKRVLAYLWEDSKL